MTDQVTTITTIVEEMKKIPERYFPGAEEIWDLLSSEERVVLGRFFGFKPWYKTEVADREIVDRLLSYKLVTWTEYNGNEGYITGTFIGAAVMRSHITTPSNVTLPGDKRP